MPYSEALKSKILKGGIYLTLRNVLSAVLSLLSVLVIARVLGPKNYGIATVAIGTFYFLIWTCRLGLNTYLVRQADLPSSGPQQVVSFYNSVGLGLCVVLWCIAPLMGIWSGQAEVTQALRLLIPAVWLDMLGMVSIAMLERDLKFDQVGLLETVAQISNYLVSVPLVLLHWSYWGPVIGTVVQYALQLVLAYRLYPVGWRWRWDWTFLGPALRYGLAYSGADWLLHFKSLRIPLLVSGILGVEAAGIAGIASRFVDQMTMLRLIIRRMSISVMARLVGDPGAIRRAVSTGMAYQALLVGPVCALFACFGTWIIPLMFGDAWLLSARIFPIIAMGTLVSALFDLHAAVLYTVGHNRDVAIANLWYVGVLWLSGLLLLPVAGLWGYALSELIALPTFWVIHRSFKRFTGSPSYREATWLVVAATPPLVASTFYSPLIALSVFGVSYGAVFLLHPDLQKIPSGLIFSLRKKVVA